MCPCDPASTGPRPLPEEREPAARDDVEVERLGDEQRQLHEQREEEPEQDQGAGTGDDVDGGVCGERVGEWRRREV